MDDEDRNEEDDIEIPDSIFKDEMEEIKRWNQRLIRSAREDVARGYMTRGEAELYLEHELVDLRQVVEKASELEAELQGQVEDVKERYESGELSEFGAEIEMDRLYKRKFQFTRQLHLNSVGLDWDDISDVVDDAVHLVQDGYDPDGRQTRKEIIEDLKKVPHEDRRAIIDELYENGRIDEKQYSYLCREFLR